MAKTCRWCGGLVLDERTVCTVCHKNQNPLFEVILRSGGAIAIVLGIAAVIGASMQLFEASEQKFLAEQAANKAEIAALEAKSTLNKISKLNQSAKPIHTSETREGHSGKELDKLAAIVQRVAMKQVKLEKSFVISASITSLQLSLEENEIALNEAKTNLSEIDKCIRMATDKRDRKACNDQRAERADLVREIEINRLSVIEESRRLLNQLQSL